MISIEEVRKLAGLARIEMPEGELEELRGQLDEILGYVGEVQKADTSSLGERSDLPGGGLTSGEIAGGRNVFREDAEPHETGKHTDEIVANFPKSEKGYLKVKKILEK